MKVSGLAKGVIAAPVNAEDRKLKVCASLSDKEISKRGYNLTFKSNFP
jgi:hypothetical protein